MRVRVRFGPTVLLGKDPRKHSKPKLLETLPPNEEDFGAKRSVNPPSGVGGFSVPDDVGTTGVILFLSMHAKLMPEPTIELIFLIISVRNP